MTKDSNKSIAFVLGGLNYGGAERVASHLINHWYKTGWDIKLISRRGPENDFYSVPADLDRTDLGGEGPSGNKLIAFLKNVPYVMKLRKAIKESGAPVVVSFLTKTNIHTILACIGLKKKVIISERNDTTRQKYPWPWPVLREKLYRYANIVTANSEIALEGMRNYVPEEKLILVPNPVFIPEEEAQPEHSKKILNVGRLVPQKQQHLIVQALSKVDPELIVDWSVEILGDGEEEENLRKMVEDLNVEKYVTLHGLVKETAPHYLGAAIFVLSSNYEGTPNALLESMSFGLPPIVSDSLPGALEIIEDGKNGLVFSSGDAEDLAKKLMTLMKHPEQRLEIGTNARKTVSKFSPDEVMPVWNKLIQSSKNLPELNQKKN